MKCTIPEISWHNRDPVLSVDIQPKKLDENFYRLVSGGTDSHVLIWQLKTENGVVSLECAADLTRHQKPVNAVRFSPSGDLLASGDDDACIIIWKQKAALDAPDYLADNTEEFKEQWIVDKVLRGHLQDVYDLSWSPDSKSLISGSVDNTAVLWDVTTGKKHGILSEHKGFVQGVSWDPCGKYVATMASDRFLRIFNSTTKKIISRVSKGKLPKTDPEAKPTHLFHDDTLKTFFRRLTFTPDGELIIVPSGVVEQPGGNPSNSTLVFSRRCLSKPVLYLPSMNQYTVAARCCPVLFTLRPMIDDKPLFDLPYRVVIAIATHRSVLLYDTQHAAPIAFITNIHYTRLTDLTWSDDGKFLVISSTDGYCSIIIFADGELGVVYKPMKENKPVTNKDERTEVVKENKPVPNKDERTKVVKENKSVPNEDERKEVAPKIVESNKENVCQGEVKGDKLLTFEGKITPLSKDILPASVSQSENKSSKVQQHDPELKSSEEKMEVDFQLVYEESTQQKLCDDKTEGPSGDIEMKGNDSTPKVTPQKDSSFVSPKSNCVTPTGSETPGQLKKTPRRVQLITLSSPKRKKKLL